jgi:hypothetical protein
VILVGTDHERVVVSDREVRSRVDSKAGRRLLSSRSFGVSSMEVSDEQMVPEG